MRGLTRFLVWTSAILGAIALLLYLLVFDVWQVQPQADDIAFTASILPALKPEDKILIKRGSTPHVGELARCKHPTSNQWVVGRVFGEQGDRVEVDDYGVKTNNRAMSAAHGCPQVIVAHPITQALTTLNCGVVETGAWSWEYLSPQPGEGVSVGTHNATVEAGKLYLVSDNRLMHDDSRDFGQVDAATCEHIVFRLYGERFTDSSRRFSILW